MAGGFKAVMHRARSRVKDTGEKLEKLDLPDLTDLLNSQSASLIAKALAETAKLIGIMAPVPGLLPAAEIVCAILVACKKVKVNEESAKALATRCFDLAKCIGDKVRSEGSADAFESAIDEMTETMKDIEADMTAISQCPSFWHAFRKLNAYTNKIELANKRLDNCVEKFHIRATVAQYQWLKRFETAVYKDQEQAALNFALLAAMFPPIMQALSELENKVDRIDCSVQATLAVQVAQDLGNKVDLKSRRRTKDFKENLRRLSKARNDLAPAMELVAGQVQKGREPVYTFHLFSVWQGTYQGRQVSVKVFQYMYEDVRLGDLEADMVQHSMRFRRELKLWSKLNESDSGDHFARLYGYCTTDDKPYIVSEWLDPDGLLSTRASSKQSCDIGMLRNWIVGVACCLEKMHKLDMMHGDIRPENVFLKSNGKPMLTGFGLTKIHEIFLTENVTQAYSEAARYRPCEHSQTGMPMKVSLHADIWSFAMTVLFVLSGKHPYHSVKNNNTVHGNIARGDLPERPIDQLSRDRGLDDSIWTLLTECWRRQPTERPTIQQVMARLQEMWPETAREPHCAH